MKTHKKREGGDAEGDQSLAIADVEQSYRTKEKKSKKKIVPLMACNSEVEEDGNEMDENEEMEEEMEERKDEKLKRKVKTANVMVYDEKERKEENNKKKKKGEKRDEMMLSDDKAMKPEKKKKKKRIGDVEVERSQLRSDDMKADDEEDKGEKGKKRKRKEKEKKGYKAVHEEQNTTNDAKEKKKGKKDQMMVLDDKETKDEIISAHGRGSRGSTFQTSSEGVVCSNGSVKQKPNVASASVTFSAPVAAGTQTTVQSTILGKNANEMEGGKAGNKEKKRRKEKKTKDDTVAGHEELKKVKEKKKKKKEKEAGKAESPEVKQDETQKSKKRANAADSSEPVIPKRQSKKVKFLDEVTVFSPPDERKKVKSKYKGRPHNDEECKKMLGKRFTKEEDELIVKAVNDYIEAKELGEEGLGMVLRCSAHPEVKGCWREIRKALPWREQESIYNRAHSLLERGDSTWTPEDVELVLESYKKHGANWKAVAAELGKFRIHVKDAFRRNKLPNRRKGHWSQDEYQNLFELVNKDLQMKVFEEKRSKYGMLKDDISWQAISETLGTRTNACCLMKWYNQLTSSMVAEGEWADVDDYWLLMELVELDASCEEEVDWDCLLEHRSGDICRKRWKQMANHLGEHGTKSFSEQVEVLSNRYCPELLETREKLDARPIVD